MATEWLQESQERESQEAAAAAAAAVMCVCVCVSVGEQLPCALEPSSATDGDSGCRRVERETHTQETAAAAAAAAPAAHSTGSRSGGVSANRFANGANQNCGNFLTGRPTSRVLAPPGGKSSGPLW